MKKITKHITFFLFLLGVQLSCFSQEISGNSKIKFDNFSIEKGLSQSTVLSIFNDSYGFIWVGTRNGLNKFNGYDFKIFQNKINDSTSIGGNIIYDITQDQDNQLYIATSKGLSLFNEHSNQFTNHQFPAPFQNSKPNALDRDTLDRLWISTNQGLMVFNKRSASFEHLSNLIDNNFEKTKKAVYATYIDDNNLLWAGTSNNGIYAVSIQNEMEEGFEVKYDFSPEEFSDVRIEDILPAENERLWIATYGKGLYLMEKNGEIVEHYHKESLSDNYKITNNSIRTIAYDNAKNLWIGTFEGLNILNTTTGNIKHINYTKGDPQGLPHGSIRKITKDNKGSMWIGTYFGGVSYFDEDNQKFTHYYNIPGSPQSLSFNVIGAFSEDTNANILIGTERGGLNILNNKSKNHTHFIQQNDDIISNLTIKSIKTTDLSKHWLGTFKQGLKKYDSENKTFSHFPKGKNQNEFKALKNAIVNCIEIDANGLLWLGLDKSGSLAVFDPKSEKFIHHPIAEKIGNTINGKPVKHIVFDDNGDIFISTRGSGIVHYDNVEAKVNTFKNFVLKNEFLEFADINHIKILNDKLWVSSHGSGLFNINKDDKILENHIKLSDGLLSNIIYGTITDAENNLWILSSNGLSRLTNLNNNYSIKNYNYASGFPIQEINEGAFYKTASNEFLIGGNNGYVKFKPENLIDNTYNPQVILSNLQISNKGVLPNDDHEVLDQPIYDTKDITLNYKQSIFTLEFVLLNYLSPENNQYAYKLDGFDEDWVNIGNNRSATYTNLKSGEYTFMVKGANNDNVWNNEATLLNINILPPPWKTWWAYSIYTLLIILGLIIIRQNALKGAKMKLNLHLEKVEKEKLKELHLLKLKYFTDISHEFRTPLTLITSPLEELLDSNKGNKWVRKKLKIMYYSSKRLLLLVDQILEFREIESGNYKLNLEPVNLFEYLTQVADSFKTLADKKSIQLDFEYQTDQGNYMIDKDKTDKILFNLLSNAFKFTPEGGKILLKVTSKRNKAQKNLNFHISDTGIGIEKSEIDKVFKRFYTTKTQNSGSGIGLSFTKSLVEILNGSIKVLKSDSKGTEFLLQLPYKKTNETAIEELEKKDFLKPIPLEYNPSMSEYQQINKNDKTTPHNLLIVEDTAELRNYLKEQLEDTYKVYTAVHGKDALKILHKKNINLVVSDVMMPEMDGLELCETIKKTTELSHVPVILLTAKTSYIERLEGLDSGADDYIAKPFHLKEIKSRINNIIENRNRLQDKFKKLNYFDDIEVDIGLQDEQLLEKLIKILEDKIDDPTLTVDVLSKELGLSRVHLFRKMKAIAGMTPSAFIKDFRMKKARAIILDKPSAQISEVAYSVGFQDPKYFSKCFKKHFKKSPNKLKEDQKDLQQFI